MNVFNDFLNYIVNICNFCYVWLRLQSKEIDCLTKESEGKMNLSQSVEVFEKIVGRFRDLYEPAGKLCIALTNNSGGDAHLKSICPIGVWIKVSASGHLVEIASKHIINPQVWEEKGECFKERTPWYYLVIYIFYIFLICSRRHSEQPDKILGIRENPPKSTWHRRTSCSRPLPWLRGKRKENNCGHFFLRFVSELLTRKLTYCGTLCRREFPDTLPSVTECIRLTPG